MSADIKPGDLVVVVHPSLCCGSTQAIGKIGTVEPNPSWATYCQCDFCGAIDLRHERYRTIEGGGYQVETLKKIDPTELSKDLQSEKELETV